MTSQPTEPNHIQQTLFAEAFPVNQLAKQGTEKASRRLQGLVSGSNSSEPYAWYDQNTSSWKTYQRSLLTEWTSFSETFTRQGTMQNGVVYQAALLELATKEIDGGLLPTPIASKAVEQKARFKQGGYSLRAALNREMLPTPRANSAMSQNLNITSIKNHPHPNLETVVSQLPTPRASEPGRTNQGYGDNLKEGICKQIGIPTKKHPLLPTPTATDYKGRSGQGFIDRHGKRRISDVLTQTGDNMYLNPRFVEEMMGYEIGWTDLKH